MAFEGHLPRALEFAHRLIEGRVQSGDLAIDATVGNGHDTLFLAKLVGETGAVVGCDIQASAIESTTEKVSASPWVKLHHTGHENLDQFLPEGQLIKAGMFNLGYLPGSDKSLITRSETTLAALQRLLPRLTAGGLITLVLYSGHEGGKEEVAAVTEWAGTLEQEAFSVASYQFINQRNAPPSLLVIEKK